MRSLGSQGQPQYALGMASTSMHSSVPEASVARPITTTRSEGIDPSYERELARQSAATRRAVVLGLLTFVLLVSLLTAFAGLLPKWAPIVFALPVIGFVIAAAMTASERSKAPGRTSSAATRTERRPRAQQSAAPSAEQVAAPEQSQSEWENWNAWDDEESWDAVPTTLPTYVTAPRASAVPRGIDRSHPGEWTGSAMVETAQAMRGRPRTDPLLDSAELVDHGADTAEIPAVRSDYDDRRAVNQ